MVEARSKEIRKIFIAVAVVHFIATLVVFILSLRNLNGLMQTKAQPLGRDFINLLTTARLIVSDQVDKIYVPQDYSAFQHTIIDADIGLRLWAYPPHSLLPAWLMAGFDFIPGLVFWSVFGIVFLIWAAARYGFNRWEITLLVLSPAALQCIASGQTGNFATALLLLALSARGPRDKTSIFSAALLTIKPQIGFLLPVLWLLRRNWFLLVGTTVATLALVGATVAFFGVDIWRQYLFETIPVLGQLEKYGAGLFMTMIPSVFMSARIFSIDGTTALYIHWVFVTVFIVWLLPRLHRTKSRLQQDTMLLLTTCLITPYIHFYDLGLLTCAGLLILRGADDKPAKLRIATYALVVLAWALPELMKMFYILKFPISPLIILSLFALSSPFAHDDRKAHYD